MIKNRFKRFLESSKDVPLLVGLISGLYPFLFFYSNNYTFVNTWEHAGFFFLVYVVPAVILTVLAYYIFGLLPQLKPYRKHLLFVLMIMITSSLLSYMMYFTFKKKVLLCILVVACLLSLKLHGHYKKLLLLIVIMAVMPVFRVAIHIYEDLRPVRWTKQNDDIVHVKFTHKPNVYMIQPDGYAGRTTMEKPPYSYNNYFYGWLKDNGFSVYDGFRSNYPASLASNASMFAMKHHYFDAVMFPSEEMPNAREVILQNDVLRIFRSNGYETFLIAQDEYFQQNKSKIMYDHYNINSGDRSLIVLDPQLTRDVSVDLRNVLGKTGEKPRFVFIERVLPHHVALYGNEGKKAKRDIYIDKVKQSNEWLKKTLTEIQAKDNNAVIMILADHGGWVGIDTYDELYSTKDESLIGSTFGNLAAIYWNGLEHNAYDKDLKTNVNIFRVLFSCLAENTSYLKHLEKDESYNIRHESFGNGVYKLIDENGNIVSEKH